MLINLRNAMMAGRRKPTAKDYVQDGLIAMWDGIENAGWGVHDASATVWKDLTGNGLDITLTTNAIVDETAMRMATSNFAKYGIGRVSHSFTHSELHLEACLKYMSGSSGSKIIVCAGPVSTENTPCLIAQQGKYFEWSKQYDSTKEAFANNRILTVSAGYGKGYVDAQQFTYKANDTWNFNTGWICIAGDSRSNNYPLAGSSMYNVRIYNRALTADEIAHNYAIDKERFNLP